MSGAAAFYDGLAGEYDKLFADWDAATHRQADILDGIFAARGVKRGASVLDCACGIGTQAIGLARLGYSVTGSDISRAELAEAERRAEAAGVRLTLAEADFRRLGERFGRQFEAVIAMDNALPHLLSRNELIEAAASIASVTSPGGLFLASIRDYDAILENKPAYSPPYIRERGSGRQISFQTWDWHGDNYSFVQYIIDDGAELTVSRHQCEYRALRRAELTEALTIAGFRTVRWLMPEETGFYQPIAAAIAP